VEHLEHRYPEDSQVDLRDSLEFPILREHLYLRIDTRLVFYDTVDDFLTKPIVFPWLLQSLEENPEIVDNVRRGIDAPCLCTYCALLILKGAS
jgi:hypothetical protein